MPWKGIVGEAFTPQEFHGYVQTINWSLWQPEFITIHHTGIPTLGQRPNGLTYQHILGLEAYYRDEMGWNSGPHLFIDDRQIWVFTPLNVKGVHAKSFNTHGLGIEMLGDYDREDFHSGRGLLVQQNTVSAIAILTAALGLDPNSLMFHRDDPNTNKTCPGGDVDKDELIQLVLKELG